MYTNCSIVLGSVVGCAPDSGWDSVGKCRRTPAIMEECQKRTSRILSAFSESFSGLHIFSRLKGPSSRSSLSSCTLEPMFSHDLRYDRSSGLAPGQLAAHEEVSTHLSPQRRNKTEGKPVWGRGHPIGRQTHLNADSMHALTSR